MAYGVTTAGFVAKRLEDIKNEIQDDLRASLGPELSLLPQSVLGQIVGIYAERESLLWELAEAVYNSAYPDTAEGTSLDNVAAITGTIRKAATKSTVTGLAEGTAGTTIISGSVVSVTGNSDARFETSENYTILANNTRIQRFDFSDTPDSGAWKIDYNGSVTGSLAYNITATILESELETITGESLRVTGSMADGFKVIFRSEGTYLDFTEDTNTLLEGANPITITIAKQPAVFMTLSAQDTGEVDAPADSLTVIETPIGGWTSFINLEDATVGRALETDDELKLRRLEEIAIAGKATLNAIRSALTAITDVTAVVIFQNITSITDGDGRPPHSVDIVVQGGDEDEIADTIFETVAAGIETIGDVTKSVTDSQGFLQTIKFSRPSEVDIYVDITLTTDPTFPADGSDQVEAGILAYGNDLEIGEDVITYPKLMCSFADVEGITDVVLKVGTAPSPASDDNVIISAREIASFDSARIDITVV